MKNLIKFLFIFLMSLTILVGCNESNSSKTENVQTEEVETFKVRFIVDGNLYDTIKIESGKKIKFPDEPYKEGCEFLGWYTEDDELIDDRTKVNEKLTLYAKFSDEDIPSRPMTPTEPVTPTEPIPTIPQDQCDHLTLELMKADLSSSACDSILYYEFCIDCGYSVINNTFTEIDCDFIYTSSHTEYDEYGDMVEIVKGYCSYCSNRITVKTKTEHTDGCEIKEAISISFYDGNFNPIIENVYDFVYSYEHNYYTDTIESLGNCISDGCLVTERCYYCDAVNTYTQYGHSFEYDEHYVGDCYTKFYGDKCKYCKVYQWIGYDLNCRLVETYSHSSSFNEGITHNLEYECADCNLKFFVTKDTKQEFACSLRVDYAVSYDDYSFFYTDYEEVHDLEYISPDFKGDCNVGHSIDINCKNCEYRDNYYYYDDHFLLSETKTYNQLCSGLKVNEYTCALCDYVNSDYIENNVWNITESSDTFEKYSCYNGCCIKEITYEIIRYEDKCDYIERKVLNYFNNGDHVVSLDVDYQGINHNFEFEPTLYGTTCDDGYTLKVSCLDCEYEEVYENHYGHYNHDTRTLPVTCANTVLYNGGCRVCGYDKYFFKEENLDVWNLVVEDGETKIYNCINGCCEKKIYVMAYEDGCVEYTMRVYEYISNDKILATYSETISVYSYHEYERIYELEGIDCAQGYVIKITCIHCGDEGTTYGEIHSPVFTEVSMGGDGACGTVYNVETCEICQYVLGYYIQYDNCDWEYVEDIPLGIHERCSVCERDKYTETYTIPVDSDCYTHEISRISIALQGATIDTLEKHSFYYQHDYIYETSGYLICEAYYDLTTKCSRCDYSQYENTIGHLYEENSYYVEAEGFCGTYISVPEDCVLCNEKRGVILTDSKCNFDYYYEDEEGTTYKQCRDCGAKLVIHNQILSRDNLCNLRVEHVLEIIYNDTVIATETYYSEYTEHEYEITYELDGHQCFEGVSYSYDCKHCNLNWPNYGFSHLIEDEYYVLDDTCGIIVWASSCLACDHLEVTIKYPGCEMVTEKSEFFDTYYEDTIVCSNCDLRILIRYHDPVIMGSYEQYYIEYFFYTGLDSEEVLYLASKSYR